MDSKHNVMRGWQCLKQVALVLGWAVLSALLASCFPSPPADDEGHASFAREAVPVVLGRRAYGVDEVEVIADIAQFLGRDTATAMLMKDPAFVDHWTDVIVDLLKIQRDTLGGIAAQDQNCWGEPTRATPDSSIAIWVRDHGPNAAGAPTPAWNMVDLIRSAIVLDDLSPIYRANLFTFSMRLSGSSDRRQELTPEFLRTYLNRDITCLRCHNPTLSASNKTNGSGDIVWRRLWNIPGHPEKALFGNYYDTTATTNRIAPIFRGDVRQAAGASFGIRPWGMSESCATDTDNPTPANNGVTLVYQGFKTLPAAAPGNPNAALGSLSGASNPRVAIWELEAALRDGISDLHNGYERFTAAAPLLPPAEQQYCDVVQVFSANCVGCHSGGSPSGGLDLSGEPASQLVGVNSQAGSSTLAKRVVAGSLAQSELSRRINAASYPPRMPPGGSLSTANQDLIDAWITAGATSIPTSQCNTSDVPDVAPDEALAFLTAANLVDGIWMSAMGYRLTIDHGFPRNQKQRDMLWNLTEYEFVGKHWSLQTLLRKMLSSTWFARRAPVISQASNAYQLPLVLDPWVEADPTEAGTPAAHQLANGQGELVERFRVNTFLRTLASSLGWQKPRHFPGAGYPSPLDQDLGQYLSPGTSGFSGVNFQSLLALESQTGLCNKAGKSVVANDWIDQLVSSIVAFNNANPDAPISLAESWQILKDRLIQDPTIETSLPSGLSGVAGAQTEQQALQAFFNQGLGLPNDLGLNTSTGDLTANQLTSKLRQACGIVVKTSEFMLTNLTPRGYSDNNMPDPPRLNVCLDGEACGYAASCGFWRTKLSSMGQRIACEDRSVRHQPLSFKPFPGDLKLDLDHLIPRLDKLCPIEICSFVKTLVLDDCLKNPEACLKLPPMPPPCDPRFGAANACGGRLPADVHESGVLVLWADGARVKAAEAVRILPAGQRRWLNLDQQQTLHVGDLLYLPLQGRLQIDTGERQFGVDPIELDKTDIEDVHGHYLSITGEGLSKILDAHTAPGAMSFSALRAAVDKGAIESRGIKPEEWSRIIGYGALPMSQYTPSEEEIALQNQDFAALHFPKDSGLTADGGDLLTDEPVVEGPGTEPPSTGTPPSFPGAQPALNIWVVLVVILVLINILLLVAYSRKAGSKS